MQKGNTDPGFESYRRERKRRQRNAAATGGEPMRAAAANEGVIRELEQVEMKEMQDQRLSKEVHEFFSSATKIAAQIVQRVAETAQAKAGERLTQEMEEFLLESLDRMNTLVLSVMAKKNPQIAQTDIEPLIQNIVGQSLDNFRFSGTAGADKHLGQDPFDTDLEEVCREFRAQVPAATADSGPGVLPAEPTHRATELMGDVPQPAAPPAPPTGDAIAAAGAATPVATGAQPEAAPEAAGGEPASRAGSAVAGALDLDRFKEALKTLVRQGTMSKDEARAAWHARLAKNAQST